MTSELKKELLAIPVFLVVGLAYEGIGDVKSYLATMTITTNIFWLIMGSGIIGYTVYLFTKHVVNREALKKLDLLPKVYDEKKRDVINDFLDNMKSDCYVSGVSLDAFATGVQDKIIDLIKKGKHFTFLLPHPNSEFLKAADDFVVSLDSRSELLNQLTRFKQLYDKLTGDDIHKIHVKFHHLPLIHSILIVDPNLDEGKLDISLYDFNKNSQFRTGITIIRKHSKNLFDKHYISLKKMLENSKTTDWNFSEFTSSSDTR